MGRHGGYGRTGEFANKMQLKVWYSFNDIQAFFRARKQNVTLLQAKAIVDSLNKSKCYSTERKVTGQGVVMILLHERIRYKDGWNKLPDDLISQTVDLDFHFTSLLLNSDWGSMPTQKVFDLEKGSSLINEITQASQESRPIKYEGVLCALVACKNKSSTHVRIALEEVSKEILGEMSKDIYLLQLS